ncbi:hypothetical protein V2J09_012062 [Rumex salicifolius]
MLPQSGIKLAVNIVTTDFGNLVAKVCECLLRRGTLTRFAIAKHTELPTDKVTKCLWVLIQHNCVQAFALAEEGGYGESQQISTQYMALFNNMICRMRFPKVLTVVSKELDKECASVLEGLLQHGRLTLSQVLDRATAFSNEGGIVRERFMKLVEARYIERCPAAEPLVSLKEEVAGKKRGARSNKIAENELTLEDRVIAAATLMEAERFSVKTDAGKDITEVNKSNELNNKKIGKKRKHKPLEVDGDIDISGCNKDPAWRVNFDEFKHLFRKKVCVESAKSRLDHEAGIVLSAFLEAAKAMGNRVSLSIEDIFEEVIKSEEGRTMTLEHIRAFLEQLGCDSVDPDDLAEIIKCAQREEVESIVLKRYGKEAYRLFRLLIENRHPVETSGISGKTLVDHKDTKKLLYKMWMENYLHMEFVRRPQQGDLFCWSVNRNLNELVLEELLHAALNLRIRAAFEMDQGREVFMLQDKQKGEAKKRFDRLKAVKKLLDSSLAKLDDAIMLFHDF